MTSSNVRLNVAWTSVRLEKRSSWCIPSQKVARSTDCMTSVLAGSALAIDLNLESHFGSHPTALSPLLRAALATTATDGPPNASYDWHRLRCIAFDADVVDRTRNWHIVQVGILELRRHPIAPVLIMLHDASSARPIRLAIELYLCKSIWGPSDCHVAFLWIACYGHSF